MDIDAMTEAHWFDMDHPGDYSRLQTLLDNIGDVDSVAVMAKTEGHTAANDFARQLSRSVLDPLLAPWTSRGRAVAVLANGCEGAATPGGYAFVRRSGASDAPGSVAAAPGLRLGIARSPAVSRADIGTPLMIDIVSDAVKAAVEDSQLGGSAGAVALVVVKCPTLLVSSTLNEPFRSDQHRGRALAALGVAVGLGEIARERIGPDDIARDLSLYSRRAMTFAGPEESWVEVIVLGNVRGADDAVAMDADRIGVCHPLDMLDAASVRRLLLSLGMRFDEAGELIDGERVLAILSKAGPEPGGRIRGARTGIFSSAWSPDSNMRAAQSGLLGGLFGTTRFFVSGDPIQQAPEGGGVVAVVVKGDLRPDHG